MPFPARATMAAYINLLPWPEHNICKKADLTETVHSFVWLRIRHIDGVTDLFRTYSVLVSWGKDAALIWSLINKTTQHLCFFLLLVLMLFFWVAEILWRLDSHSTGQLSFVVAIFLCRNLWYPFNCDLRRKTSILRSLAKWELPADAKVPTHSHPNSHPE